MIWSVKWIAEGLLKGKVAEIPEPGIVSIESLLTPFRNPILARERARSYFCIIWRRGDISWSWLNWLNFPDHGHNISSKEQFHLRSDLIFSRPESGQQLSVWAEMISNLWVIMIPCPMFYPAYPSSKLVACYIVTTETFDMMRFHFFTKLYLAAPQRESVWWLNEALWADITSDSDLDPQPVSAAPSGSMNIPGRSFYKSIWFQVSGS